MKLSAKHNLHVQPEDFFLTVIWLPHGQFWAIIEQAASPT